MRIRLAAVFCLLLLASCRPRPDLAILCPPPTLGIAAGPELQVVGIEVGGPAEKAGVRIGDVLVDIRPPAVNQGTPLGPAPFRAPGAVDALIQATMTTGKRQEGLRGDPAAGCNTGTPLLMRVQRGGETVELEITPDVPQPPSGSPSASPLPTPTPVMPPTYRF
ncbi:MAG TPA: hypothetical protein VNK95_25435 [Caldilineaceae bacterium]|nr:hypothetical protein [Caldilineaceae bacterium]